MAVAFPILNQPHTLCNPGFHLCVPRIPQHPSSMVFPVCPEICFNILKTWLHHIPLRLKKVCIYTTYWTEPQILSLRLTFQTFQTSFLWKKTTTWFSILLERLRNTQKGGQTSSIHWFTFKILSGARAGLGQSNEPGMQVGERDTTRLAFMGSQEPGLEHRDSNMWCGHSKLGFNHWPPHLLVLVLFPCLFF